MIKKKINKQKHSASQPAGAKSVHPVRSFIETGTMYVDCNATLQIKENSP